MFENMKKGGGVGTAQKRQVSRQREQTKWQKTAEHLDQTLSTLSGVGGVHHGIGAPPLLEQGVQSILDS